MIDDHKRNLHAAKELGITTVFLGEGDPQELGVDYVISDLNKLLKVVNDIG